MPTHAFVLTTLSKMHVGDDSNRHAAGAIDKLIQRDRETDYPYISSKSLRGALKENLKRLELLTSLEIKVIFGEGSNTKNSIGQGKINFDDAYLASLPVRSDKTEYFHVSSVRILEHLSERFENYGLKNITNFETEIEKVKRDVRNKIAVATIGDSVLENKAFSTAQTTENYSFFEELLGSSDRICWVNHDHSDTDLKRKNYSKNLLAVLSDDNHLPVESHNALTNGISRNLWYEQILLPKTRFYFFISYNEKILGVKEYYDKLETALLSEPNPPFQFGSDASLNYGNCKITKLNLFDNDTATTQ